MFKYYTEAVLSFILIYLRYISVVIIFKVLYNIIVLYKEFVVIELVVLNYIEVYKIVILLYFSYTYKKERYYLFVRNRSFYLANS